MKKLVLAVLLLPLFAWAAWAGVAYLQVQYELARWDVAKARAEAVDDIKNGTWKVYVHGGFTATVVGVSDEDRHLVARLARLDAGVGCVVPNDDIYDAQGAYARQYNQLIVTHLKRIRRGQP